MRKRPNKSPMCFLPGPTRSRKRSQFLRRRLQGEVFKLEHYEVRHEGNGERGRFFMGKLYYTDTGADER